MVRAGKIIPLAAVMSTRSPLLPEVPTFNETVIKGFEVAPWVSMFGPANLPPAIVKQVSDALGVIIRKPDIAQKIGAMGTELYYAPTAEFTAFVKSDIPVWHAHAKTAGIVPQ